jgi:hypothetical protein
MIADDIKRLVAEFTDHGSWKASWHWNRDGIGRITLEGAEQMLRDLACNDDSGIEIAQAVATIRKRYELADELRKVIAAMREECRG